MTAAERGPNDKPPLVLVVDEIKPVIRLLELMFGLQGFRVAGCEVGEETYHSVESLRPDIIVLEVLLPGMSGYEMLKELKQRYDIPVLVLTTVETDADRAYAFELGADDYVVKPFEPLDLAQRVTNLIGGPRPEAHTLQIGDLFLDLTRQIARRGDRVIGLTMNEWAVLLILANRAGERVSMQEVLQVLEAEPHGGQALMEMLVTRLRQNLEVHPDAPQVVLGTPHEGLLLNVPG